MLDPLLQEAMPIPSHALAAMGAVVLGGVQLASAKGTALHRALGRAWVGLMTYVVISSFFMSELRPWGALSPTHLLSLDPILTGDGGSPRPSWQYSPAQDLDGAALHSRSAGDRRVHAVARSSDAWRIVRRLVPCGRLPMAPVCADPIIGDQ